MSLHSLMLCVCVSGKGETEFALIYTRLCVLEGETECLYQIIICMCMCGKRRPSAYTR